MEKKKKKQNGCIMAKIVPRSDKLKEQQTHKIWFNNIAFISLCLYLGIQQYHWEKKLQYYLSVEKKPASEYMPIQSTTVITFTTHTQKCNELEGRFYFLSACYNKWRCIR